MPPLPASVFSSALPLSGHSIDSSISGSDKAAGGPAGPPTNIEWTDKEPPARRQPQTSASPDQLHHQISTSNPHISQHLQGQARLSSRCGWSLGSRVDQWPTDGQGGWGGRREGGRQINILSVISIPGQPGRHCTYNLPTHQPWPLVVLLTSSCKKAAALAAPGRQANSLAPGTWVVTLAEPGPGEQQTRMSPNLHRISPSLWPMSRIFLPEQPALLHLCSTLAQIVFKWTFCTRRRN